MRNYLMLFSVLLLLLHSCEKPPEVNPSQGGQGTTADSISLLRGTGLGAFAYDSDTLPSKLYTFNTSPYGGPWYKDTTFIYYTPDKKVSRFFMEAVTTDYSANHFRMPYFLVYSQG